MKKKSIGHKEKWRNSVKENGIKIAGVRERKGEGQKETK